MMRDKESKLVCCYELKYGNNSREETCKCTQESAKYNDDKELQRLQKESEDELERARQMLQKTENSAKQNRANCVHMTHTPMSKSPSKTGIPVPRIQYKSGPPNESREAIKRLTKVPMGKGSDSADGRIPGMSGWRTTMQKLLPHCPPPAEMDKDSKELPKKPKLTTEELGALLDQEARDVESAWILTTDNRESFKRPCPKQQKAREAVRALIEPKKEEPPPPPPPPPREPLPFLDPDPDDISPEVAANMMYTQERGIKMISCPEETVKHLFAQQLGNEDKDLAPEGDANDEILESDLDETADLDDAAFTRRMAEKDTGNDPGNKDSLKKDRRDSGYTEATTATTGRKTEYLLQEKEAKCVNRVQLRGNCAPWFPGYYVALPGQVGESGIQVAKSPSGVFQKAWMAAKPTSVPSTDLYLVE